LIWDGGARLRTCGCCRDAVLLRRRAAVEGRIRAWTTTDRNLSCVSVSDRGAIQCTGQVYYCRTRALLGFDFWHRDQRFGCSLDPWLCRLMRRLDTDTNVRKLETIREAIGIRRIIALPLRTKSQKGAGHDIFPCTLRLGLRLQQSNNLHGFGEFFTVILFKPPPRTGTRILHNIDCCSDIGYCHAGGRARWVGNDRTHAITAVSNNVRPKE